MNVPNLDWEVVVASGAELGERPFWDAGQGALMWVDIKAGHLHRHRPGAGDEIVLETSGAALGAAASRRGGHVLATSDGFRLAGPGGQIEEGAPSPWPATCCGSARGRGATPPFRLAAK